MSPRPHGPALLVAVTGLPGSGKTTLLARLAAERTSLGERVDGVLARAENRPVPNRGAERYWLRLLGRDEELLWAERNEDSNPPYHFDDETFTQLKAWATALVKTPAPPVLVLDEFGRAESQGGGLMPLWPQLCAADPGIVVMAVRTGCEGAIEVHLGRKFDLRIPANAPDAMERLRHTCESYGEWTRVGLVGGAAGSIEMSVGAALHAARIPARGLALCSLQGAMMTFAGFSLSAPARVIWVPFISAGLKALSPSGQRVRPMVAIVMQGLLYGGAVQLVGWNAVGVALGGALIGTWSALQGLALQYLLMGSELLEAYDATVLWIAKQFHIALPSLPVLAAGWTAVSALIAGSVAFGAWWMQAPPRALRELIERGESGTTAPGGPAKRRGRWVELARWQFWLPLLFVSAVLLASGRSWEAVAWLSIRFVAVAVLMLTLLSFFQPAALADFLRRRGWWGPAVAFSGALRRRGNSS